MESFFSGIFWTSYGRGQCIHQLFEVEFEIHDDPVKNVNVRVRRGDPSSKLIAMSQGHGWEIINESTGNRLVNDNTDMVAVLKEIAEAESGKDAKNDDTHKKLPRIIKTWIKTGAEARQGIAYYLYVGLRPLEVVAELVEEYRKWMQRDHEMREQGGFRYGSELIIPGERRFATIGLTNLAFPEPKAYWAEFAACADRPIAITSDSGVRASDGELFTWEACRFVERSSRRNRVS